MASMLVKVGITWEVPEAPSVNAFKNRLGRYWRDQDLLYDKAKLNTDRKTAGGRIEVDLDIIILK